MEVQTVLSIANLLALLALAWAGGSLRGTVITKLEHLEKGQATGGAMAWAQTDKVETDVNRAHEEIRKLRERVSKLEYTREGP